MTMVHDKGKCNTSKRLQNQDACLINNIDDAHVLNFDMGTRVNIFRLDDKRQDCHTKRYKSQTWTYDNPINCEMMREKKYEHIS